jgi:hypothetical protein
MANTPDVQYRTNLTTLSLILFKHVSYKDKCDLYKARLNS